MNRFENLYLNVGAMKAGTTWLYRQLDQHPDIVFSREKELHYLGYRDGQSGVLSAAARVERLRNAFRRYRGDRLSTDTARLLLWYLTYLRGPMNDRWYRRRFPADIGRGRYCADFSNLTCLVGAETWADLRAMTGQLRVTYLLRHPLERMWSQFKFHHQLGQQALDVDQLSAADFREFDAAHPLLLHSRYSDHIARMRRCLDDEELRVLFYDDIEHRPLQLLRDIEDFLGLPRHRYRPGKLERRINGSDEAVGPPLALFEAFQGDIERELDALQALDLTLPQRWLDAPQRLAAHAGR